MEEKGGHSVGALRCVGGQVNVGSKLSFGESTRRSGGKGAMHNKKACIVYVYEGIERAEEVF